MNCSESRLVEKLKKGDQESFTDLYERYGKKVYNLAYKMCGNQDDADDIVQSTFMRVVTDINGFREESGIYTWLYTIAKNLCLQLLEKRKKRSFSSLDTLIHTVQPEENQYVALEKQYYIEQVKEGCLLGLLRCLSFYQRMAFILNILLGVKVKDIAVILDKSETATRTLLFRARENIRGFLCKNCHYYDPDNPCRCENLIDFSVKQGWIQTMPEEGPKKQITALKIEREIKDLQKIAMIYASLEDPEPSETIIDAIKEAIHQRAYTIFNHKKVK